MGRLQQTPPQATRGPPTEVLIVSALPSWTPAGGGMVEEECNQAVHQRCWWRSPRR